MTNASETETPDTAPTDPKAVEAIGRALEAHYAELVRAPLPDKFMELLAKLEAGLEAVTQDAGADRPTEVKGRRDALG